VISGKSVYYLLVALGETCGGNRDNYFIKSRLVAHEQNADDPAVHQRAGDDRDRIGNDHVTRIAVVG
jgi:hypothetical protein